jgi:hypothetical protein
LWSITLRETRFTPWSVHVGFTVHNISLEQRMTNDRVVKKIVCWKPTSKRLAGRPKIRWEKDMKEDLRIMNINSWAKKHSE